MDKYTIMRSIEETIKKRPKVTIPINVKYSPILYSSSSLLYKLKIETKIVERIITSLKKLANGSNTIALENSDVIV